MRGRLALLWVLAAATIAAEGGVRTPVVVELFTSEGCSDCPPADELLDKLARHQPYKGEEIIPLEEHVDYWNRLGWKDPFSSPVYTKRQERYGMAFGRDSIYTPEMVVDGQLDFVGSDAERARREIVRAGRGPRALVSAALRDTGSLFVRVTVPPGAHDVDVLLAITEDGLTTDVLRGENAGRRLAHSAVVRSLVSIGTIRPKGNAPFETPVKLNLAPEWDRSALHAVVFVQERDSLRILGAAELRL